ncbi:MAG: beta-propeller domain-containing protein [Pyrinomonadaceae bacterium]
MNRIIFRVLSILFLYLAVPGVPGTNGDAGPEGSREFGRPSRKQLKAFSSEAELRRFLKGIVKRRHGFGYGSGTGSGAGSGDFSASMPPPAQATVTVTAGSGQGTESITNTQHAGVDEGGIVKMHGDYLVVLRRGRLFTVSIGNDSLKPVSSINAFGPDIDPSDSWYDEMLISGDNIVVIGYSYDRGGTELGLFKIDAGGKLSYRSTYHLRSNDYYSSRNYSSRLIGDKLIFYSPLSLSLEEDDLTNSFPALRRWHKNAKQSEFRRIVAASKVYRPAPGVDLGDDLDLHTVTTCDLSKSEMTCDATSVMGPSGNVFYVSPTSVYVWATTWDYEDEKERSRSILFRMPLDGAPPSALRVSGGPVDQFSFLEDESNGLNVLVRADSNGDGMCAEVTEGEIALLRVERNMLADGSTLAPASSYRKLEKVPGYTFQNRFVGAYLLYGTGSSWSEPRTSAASSLYAVNWKNGAMSKITLPHGVDRLDLLGGDAIVVGANGNDLYFSSVSLGALPRLVDTFNMKGASQGETRSHGFFYKPDGTDNGVLGLPVTRGGRAGDRQLVEGSASIVFLRNDRLRFSEFGTLESRPVSTANDSCKASCVDWYGNARPIFGRGRIFALLGYEIVEGSINAGRIEEIRRADFSPHPQTSTVQ